MTAVNKSPSRNLCAFRVEVCGFSPEWFRAPSIGAARYAAYRAFRDAGHRWDFLKFLVNVSVCRDANHMGRA